MTVDALIERLTAAQRKYEEDGERLGDPALLARPADYAKLMKEYRAMTPLMDCFGKYLAALDGKKEAEAVLSSGGDDAELLRLAEEERKNAAETAEKLYRELQLLLIPRDPNDDKNVMVEIRAGTGGEEAALFAADLYRMYCMYAERAGFSVTVESSNPTELGGYREIVFMVSGDGAYSRFKFESGVHRVQRVPVTGAANKLQTSAATVAVLPEAEDISVTVDPADLIFESCKSSGAGGQHINKTESAVRLTHKPTGIVVECQEERSQLQNRAKAMLMLKTKLYAMEEEKRNAEVSGTRKAQVSTGDRSAKIRTYNFPQNRVTDHRIGLTLYSLDTFLDGEIGGMIDALIASDSANKLKGTADSAAM